MAVKRKCVCCGKEYEYCPSCPKNDQPGWMVTFCSEPCKDLFNIISAYNSKRIGKDAVKKYMVEHNINSSKYVGPVKRVLEESMAIEKKTPLEVKSEPIKISSEVENVVSQPIRKEEKAIGPSEISAYANRSRRNKKRRNRQLDIELNN